MHCDRYRAASSGSYGPRIALQAALLQQRDKDRSASTAPTQQVSGGVDLRQFSVDQCLEVLEGLGAGHKFAVD